VRHEIKSAPALSANSYSRFVPSRYFRRQSKEMLSTTTTSDLDRPVGLRFPPATFHPDQRIYPQRDSLDIPHLYMTPGRMSQVDRSVQRMSSLGYLNDDTMRWVPSAPSSTRASLTSVANASIALESHLDNRI
jgi:hypothetical protein